MHKLAFRNLRFQRLGAMRAKTYLIIVDSEGNAWVSPDNELMLQEQ